MRTELTEVRAPPAFAEASADRSAKTFNMAHSCGRSGIPPATVNELQDSYRRDQVEAVVSEGQVRAVRKEDPPLFPTPRESLPADLPHLVSYQRS